MCSVGEQIRRCILKLLYSLKHTHQIDQAQLKDEVDGRALHDSWFLNAWRNCTPCLYSVYDTFAFDTQKKGWF